MSVEQWYASGAVAARASPLFARLRGLRRSGVSVILSGIGRRIRRERSMIRQGCVLGLLVLASLFAAGCTGESYTDGSISVDGEWEVDFGANQGVLRLVDGEIFAICYGPTARLGGYTAREGWLTMTMDFMDGGGDHTFAGPVLFDEKVEAGAEANAGFRLQLAVMAPGAKIEFTPFDGDCSDVTGR
jgi:hypothetical protein